MPVSPSIMKLSEREEACLECDHRARSICAELSDRDLRRLSARVSHHGVKAGQAIVRQGEACDLFYVITSGSFRVVRSLADGRRQILGFLLAGDMLSPPGEGDAAHSVEALEESEVCQFTPAELKGMARIAPNLERRLRENCRHELHRAEDHIVLLGQARAEERVLAFLQALARHPANQSAGQEHINLHLSMSRQDIADYLGLRLETLSRTLNLLKKQNKILHLEGRHLVLSPPRDEDFWFQL